MFHTLHVVYFVLNFYLRMCSYVTCAYCFRKPEMCNNTSHDVNTGPCAMNVVMTGGGHVAVQTAGSGQSTGSGDCCHW